jgi:hypothetical protein
VKQVLIRGLWGLGDNIYQRPFVAAAAKQYDLWLETPWPELYADLDIHFVRGWKLLRTQQKNMARSQAWSTPPKGVREVTMRYGNLAASTIIASLERCWRVLGVKFDPQLFGLPEMAPRPIRSERPIAVIRPVTVRSEWRNEARNPRPEYVNAIARELMATHTVIAVADLEPDAEWLVGELPPAHKYFVHGELKVRELLVLVRDADIVLGGVGWIVPAGLALGHRNSGSDVNTFVVPGGHGGHNAPEKITDSRLDLSRIGFATPSRFCRCTNMLHHCDKTIEDPVGQFQSWFKSSRRVASFGGRNLASATIRSRQGLNHMTGTILTTSPATPTPISDGP